MGRALFLAGTACAPPVAEAPIASSGVKHELLDNPAPELAGETINGRTAVSLVSLRGNVVLVDFWATWCEPCRKSFPKLEELRGAYESLGFRIVAVSEDDEQNGVREFGAAHGAKFPLMWDKDKSVANKWHPPSMPSSFLIDKKGVVRFIHLGYHEGEEKEIEAELKSLL